MGEATVNRKPKRERTPQQALDALMRLAARSERSSGDALRLMRGWGIAKDDMKRILQRLIADRFIDDRRYAAAFVRDKINLSKWGHRKIASALAAKGVASDIIAEALAEYAQIDVESRLEGLLRKKMERVRYTSLYDLRAKLMRYAASQGYAFDAISRCVATVTKDIDGGDEENFI